MLRKLCAVSLIFVSLGCLKMKSNNGSSAYSESLFLPGDGSLTPSTDKMATDCATNSSYDTCIFEKNPVAQQNGAVDSSKAQSLRLFGVKIRGLDNSGFLENARVQVLSLNTPRFSLLPAGHMKAVYADEQSYAEQLSAYYWSNLTFEYLQNRLGSTRTPTSALKIYADDAFTGFSSSNHSIHLEKKSGVLPKAFSGEVVAQLLGQALAQDLSGGKVFPGDAAKHNLCGLSPHGCCTSNAGCSQALASAFGDYVAAMVFPARPRLGEAVAGNVNGQQICSLARDLASLSTQTKDAIYNACSDKGQVTLTGTWYASLWWKVRQAQEQAEPGTSADIDALFFDHAKTWNASTTFTEAKASALQLATQYRAGKYLNALTSALSGI